MIVDFYRTRWNNFVVFPTISEAERIILENIDKQYKCIARDENNFNFTKEGVV